VAALQSRLIAAGYAVRPTGVLDPVTKSAAGDFLSVRPSPATEPLLSSSLQGTVITGKRDPVAWNARFGRNRRTQMVERPLTGPGGQLDDNGNLQR
jgi:peptidoglycan hydrolase-like protein with peptidoglycan-binding domain